MFFPFCCGKIITHFRPSGETICFITHRMFSLSRSFVFIFVWFLFLLGTDAFFPHRAYTTDRWSSVLISALKNEYRHSKDQEEEEKKREKNRPAEQ